MLFTVVLLVVLLGLLAAAAVVGVAAAPGFAAQEIPSPVYISSTGSCTTSYLEVAQAGNTAVCVYRYSAPTVRVTTTGCYSDETPYLVLNKYGACLS